MTSATSFAIVDLELEPRNWNSIMGLNEVLEEIEILRSIFCQNGEFDLHSDLECIKEENEQFSITYSVNIEGQASQFHGEQAAVGGDDEPRRPDDQWSLVLTVTVNEKYPRELECFSLNSTILTKKIIEELKEELHRFITENLVNGDEEVFMMRVVDWIKENVNDAHVASGMEGSAFSKGKEEEIKYKSVVIKLDHMRSKQKYTKLIMGWMVELALHGRVIFYKRMIWIIISGRICDVKEYIKRHKTCNVDVDSSGQPCKERMMNIVDDIDVAKIPKS